MCKGPATSCVYEQLHRVVLKTKPVTLVAPEQGVRQRRHQGGGLPLVQPRVQKEQGLVPPVPAPSHALKYSDVKDLRLTPSTLKTSAFLKK